MDGHMDTTTTKTTTTMVNLIRLQPQSKDPDTAKCFGQDEIVLTCMLVLFLSFGVLVLTQRGKGRRCSCNWWRSFVSYYAN